MDLSDGLCFHKFDPVIIADKQMWCWASGIREVDDAAIGQSESRRIDQLFVRGVADGLGITERGWDVVDSEVDPFAMPFKDCVELACPRPDFESADVEFAAVIEEKADDAPR